MCLLDFCPCVFHPSLPLWQKRILSLILRSIIFLCQFSEIHVVSIFLLIWKPSYIIIHPLMVWSSKKLLKVKNFTIAETMYPRLRGKMNLTRFGEQIPVPRVAKYCQMQFSSTYKFLYKKVLLTTGVPNLGVTGYFLRGHGTTWKLWCQIKVNFIYISHISMYWNLSMKCFCPVAFDIIILFPSNNWIWKDEKQWGNWDNYFIFLDHRMKKVGNQWLSARN